MGNLKLCRWDLKAMPTGQQTIKKNSAPESANGKFKAMPTEFENYANGTTNH